MRKVRKESIRCDFSTKQYKNLIFRDSLVSSCIVPKAKINGIILEPKHDQQMRLKLLACEIFYREISSLTANLPHRVDVEFLPQQLHVIGRVRMKDRLTEYLAAIDENCYDAILLAYGLCSGGIAGLTAGKIPLVVPRAHDCITLFLGCRKKYQDYFFANGGTYFMTIGWFEQDNALNYGIEMMPFYNKLAFIETGIEPDNTFERRAQKLAEERHWEFEKLTGDLTLLRRLLNGDWNEDFLIVPPGQQIQTAYNDEVIESIAPHNKNSNVFPLKTDDP